MKNVLKITLFLVAIAMVGCKQVKTSKEQTVDLTSFTKALNSKSDTAQLIDIRTPEEFASGHILNAVNIDYKKEDFASKMDLLDKDKPLFIYCRSGGRSGNSIAVLNELGFLEIYDLAGGIIAWNEAGLEISKD